MVISKQENNTLADTAILFWSQLMRQDVLLLLLLLLLSLLCLCPAADDTSPIFPGAVLSDRSETRNSGRPPRGQTISADPQIEEPGVTLIASPNKSDLD